MDLLNDQNSSHNVQKKSQTDDQTDSSNVIVSSPASNPEDMELNEEQLDIISGGGGGLIFNP